VTLNIKLAQFWHLLHQLKTYKGAWLNLGYFDATTRYRSTVLGPLWITISLSFLIGVLSFQWSTIFNIALDEYLPYFAIGLISWTFIAGTIIESTDAALRFKSLSINSCISIFVIVARTITKSFVIYLHNILILIPIFIFFDTPITPFSIVLWVISIILISFLMLFLGVLLAILAATYTDFKSLIESIIQASFFMTPIIWFPNQLGKYSFAHEFNPFYHLITIMRAPFLGSEHLMQSYLYVISMIFLCFCLSIIFSKNLISYKRYL